MKMCSVNIQKIYRRTPTQKCDFNKVANNLLSCKNVAFFGTAFYRNTTGKMFDIFSRYLFI